MPRLRLLSTSLVLLAACGIGGTTPARAADFPDVTPEERALTAVPGEPNVPAATLFRNARFRMMDGMDGSTSTFVVSVRRKILTEQGKRYGEVALHHGQIWRLKNLRGRTVLPDGRVIPLPENAIFRRRTSQQERSYQTVVAFPAVEVGAILDYRYEIKVDSIFMLDPWVFQEEVPVLYSEIVYDVPAEVAASTWTSDPMKVGIESERTKTLKGTTLKVYGRNLPAVPDEPFGLPFNDMASRFMLVPTRAFGGVDLFQSWASTCDLYGPYYDGALGKDRAATAKARQLAGTKGTGERDKAQAIYRFVRDEIATDESYGIDIAENTSVDAVLKDGHGGATEKTLLAIAMLRAVKIDARPVWAAYRRNGRIDLSLPNPWWFDVMLIAATIDGRRVVLAPFDRDLAFGALPPGLEGTAALLYDRKKPETLVLPETPFDSNVRRAQVTLEVGEDGLVTGKGTLTFLGHHAWSQSNSGAGTDKAAEGWTKWLGEVYPHFTVAQVQVNESLDERRITVSWAMSEREEEVLGDEVTLHPNRPWGPVTQVFTGDRRSAVLFGFADRDESELTVRWPAGFRLEARPETVEHQSDAGALSVSLEAGDGTLTYRRRFDVTKKSFGTQQQFEAIKALFGKAEKNDAQTLVLVRR